MTAGRARSSLAFLWLIAASPLFLLFTAQSVLATYGQDWDAPWNWFLPLVGPILALIVSVWITGDKFFSKTPVRSLALFCGTVIFSLLYIGALYMVILLQIFSEAPIVDVFRKSIWYLSVLQGFVVLTLHRFFIENLGDDAHREPAED